MSSEKIGLEERGHYLKLLEEAGELVKKVKAKHPEFDLADLYRIAMLMKESYDSKLSSGLRRRTIGNV